jgi:sugar O-acyltransferase (sialic acid O-acetyltransferase NeuD family)
MKSNKIRLVILGGGYGCKEIMSLSREIKDCEIISILDDNKKLHNSQIEGYNIAGSLCEWKKFPVQVKFVFAIGSYQNRLLRSEILEKLKIPNERFFSLIHPSAILYSNVEIGYGCIIQAGCIVHTMSKLGNFVVISAGSAIGVDNKIGDFTLIGGGVSTSTNVVFDNNSFVGTGSIIAPNITFGLAAMSAVGSVVFKDVEAGHAVIGNPARPYKKDDIPKKFKPQSFE